jgi:exoribonuclease-2
MSTAHRHDQDRAVLQHIAERAMRDRGLLPEFSPAVEAEVARLEATPPTPRVADGVRDLRTLPWSSIDNDTSRDLDQLTVAEARAGEVATIRVAIADVDALVPKGSATDGHARQNTTSVYTAARIFPMLPEALSTDLTSLNPEADRLAVVVEMDVDAAGLVQRADIYRAAVRNQAKLAYNGVAAWLDGHGAMPDPIASVGGLAENLRLQDAVAARLRGLRRAHGALSFDTVRAQPVFEGDELRQLDVEHKNRATSLIEDFMIAANGETARFLASRHLPMIRRVVRTPKRWDRIVVLAREHGTTLPETPDSSALEAFLTKARQADPVRFPDLSLAIIKLLGAGEYVAERPDAPAPGHFGLAVKDYSHSTAPNRRYPDLITQRLLKAAVAGQASPYAFEELDALAQHVTTQEDAANKVERQVGKSAAALLLTSRVGDRFDAIVTGASPKGTWVRLLSLPAEGRVVRGYEGMDVGEQVRVVLLSVDVQRGFIDFQGLDARR